jgi:hypothetical protein
LRKQFREQFGKSFPQEAVLISLLADTADANHFFVLIGTAADGQYGSALGAMSKFFCEQLKNDLNLDLHPSLFTAIRPQS